MHTEIRILALLILVIFPIKLLSDSGNDVLFYGESVTLQGENVIIDRSFLYELQKNPTADEWFKNYWELIYFILKHDHLASSVGIDLLMNIKDRRDHYVDHIGVENLAKALASNDWMLDHLCEKGREVHDEIVSYYIKHQQDYVVGHNPPWIIKWECEHN